MIKTKIVCTLGPACDDETVLSSMVCEGMDCARFNFSHGSHEEHLGRLTRLRSICEKLGMPVAALLDTKGPEIRTGDFDGKAELIQGNVYTLTPQELTGNSECCTISYKELCRDVEKGTHILIDDGLISLCVDRVEENGDIVCIIENGGVISSKKGVNVPNTNINLPAMTEQDISDIRFGVENDFDYVAMSFVRKASDVLDMRRLLESLGGGGIKVIAKIESREGIDNFKEILRASDGIMIARGDMGVEIPVEEVPIVQKSIIKQTYSACKPVITATQMLDSMIRNPRPTRAEASDVANAIFDGTSAIMLSGETAAGSYPLEALRIMAGIAGTAEKAINYRKRFENFQLAGQTSVTDAISQATCAAALKLNAAAIITVSKTGKTASDISRFRPDCPLLCVTTSLKVLRQLKLVWGVLPSFAQEVCSTDELFSIALDAAKNSGLVRVGELVVVTAGVPVGCSGTTNMLKVHIFGDVLCAGTGVSGKTATGELCVANCVDDALLRFEKGNILVLHEMDQRILPLLRSANGLIVECSDDDGVAKTAGLTLEIPVITNAAGALRQLRSGTVITMDAEKGIISM